MQAGKSAMGTAKENAENVAASARCGMDKTRAAAQEKMEKMTASHPAEKAEAEQRKEERKMVAEAEKQAAKEQHAAEKEQMRAGAAGTYAGEQTGAMTGHHPTTGTGHTTGGTYL